MERFVKILPVFNSSVGRDIESLAGFYSNSDLIDNAIRSLIGNDFSRDNTIAGKSVLIKPNWVKHSLNDNDEICLRTNDKLILSVLKLVLELKPAKVIIGDAPIQGCEWNKLLPDAFYEDVKQLGKRYDTPVFIKDFRRATFNPLLNDPQKELHPISEYAIIDVGAKSWLEPISRENENNFRVTCYDPRRLAESHRKGMHRYCICRELLESDVVISMPKIKTHQKTGITGALKNMVGINGDKDYLPHHRAGGSEQGGDCYPGKNILRWAAEKALDYANMNQGKRRYWIGYRISENLWKLSRPTPVHQLAASWYGNDTSWRMVMDLNTIALYGKTDGSLSEHPQRLILSICDGVIGGQGDGPLNPEPLPLGVISYTNTSSLNDICMATLMRFDYMKIPLLAGSMQAGSINSTAIYYDNCLTDLKELMNHSVPTLPPPGWVEHLKQ